MPDVIRVHQTGGLEVLSWESIEVALESRATTGSIILPIRRNGQPEGGNPS